MEALVVNVNIEAMPNLYRIILKR